MKKFWKFNIFSWACSIYFLFDILGLFLDIEPSSVITGEPPRDSGIGEAYLLFVYLFPLIIIIHAIFSILIFIFIRLIKLGNRAIITITSFQIFIFICMSLLLFIRFCFFTGLNFTF